MLDDITQDFRENVVNKAMLIPKLYRRLQGKDSIAVVVVKDERYADLVALMASAIKPKQSIWSRLFGATTSPSKDRLIDSLYVVRVFDKGAMPRHVQRRMRSAGVRETIVGRPVVQTPGGEHEMGNGESIEDKRGPMVLIIPSAAVRYVRDNSSIWERVVAADGL